MTNTEKTKAIAALTKAVEAADDAAARVRDAAIRAREEGATWAQIGNAEGITKQRAQQKYAAAVTPERIAYRAKLEAMTDLDLSRHIRGEDLAASDAQTPETPSIFSDTPAPAKVKKGSKKVDPQAPARSTSKSFRRRFLIDEPDKTAQPGTGKGPHQCPACQDTNHKTSDYGQAAFTPDCIPTKYDPPKITSLIQEKNR